MSEQTEALPQAIAAEAPSEQQQEPSLSYEQASASLTMAEMVGTPAEVERLKAIVAQHEQPQPVESETPAETPVEENTETQEQPASETTGTETQTEETAGDTPQEAAAEVKVSDRPRLTHLNDQDKALLNAVVLLTRGGMSLAEANAKVFGTQTAAAPVAEVEPAEAEAIQEPTPDVTEAETRVSELKARLKEVGQADGLYTEEIADITTELIEANAALRDAKRAQVESSARDATLEAAKKTVLSEITKEWPDLKNRDSAHWKVSRAIAIDLQDPDHPNHALSKRADFPAHCAREAAAVLGITQQPGAKPVEKAAAKPVSSPAVKPPGPASGSRASTPPAPAVTQAQRLEQSKRETEEVLTGVRSYNAPRRGGDGVIFVR